MAVSSQEQETPILIDALPDLVIGLVGIPAALSLANVIMYGFAGSFYSGLVWFLLLGAYYAMYPYWYLLFFDALRTRDGRSWYKHNISSLLYLTILAFGAVALILAVGETFDPESPIANLHTRQTYYIWYTLLFLLAHFPLIFQEDVLSILREDHLHLSRIYFVASATVFVIGAVVLIG